ncbi:MAG: hypothetical protein JSV05_08905 [Candidatus Bathyarchaeota archaeon]|nr:MAG: hypothetical protein JSV05_08905 [Candidatus Bathyarchaeota archaeon]
MQNFNRKKAIPLFILTLLIATSLLTSVNTPVGAQLSDILHLDGPSLNPIHMHGPALTPIHMHSPLGIIDLFDPMDTPWHELYPDYCESWTFTSWEDNGNGYLDSSDQIDMTNDVSHEVRWYHVDRVTMTMGLWSDDYQEFIYVEFKGPYDPFIFPISTLWHEVWPVYHGVTQGPYHIIDWIDNGSGFLDFCDYIMFEPWPGIWWHVEEYATDLILNEKIMDPLDIEWHELYPSFCNNHTTTSWEEPIDDPFPGRLSPGDQIDMLNHTTQETKWYYVDRVTFTMLVVNETDPTDWMYIEYKGPFETMYEIKTTVINSTWHEVYPFYSPSMNITGWFDNCNGVLDACDYIELHDLYADLYYGWWHVEELSIDIILNEKIDDPTGIIWHELYPDCSINNYDTLDWEDNGDGLLNPCDNITLALIPTGLTEEYHVENMTLTLNLTVEDVWGTPPFAPLERIYIEYLYAIYFGWEWMYYPKTHPLFTDWEVVCPTDQFGYPLTIENWYDNCNGVVSYCDFLEFSTPEGGLIAHVDEVAVDIIVKKITVEPIHDVAVTDVFSIYPWVYQGDIDPINVTVTNEGDFTESVNVDAYYNGIPAAPTQAVSLNPGETQTLTFNWDTTGVPPGFYQVSATASITIDDDPNDNQRTGNTEEIKLRPPFFKKPPYPDYAPSGMPDFDQKQPGWGPGQGIFTWCGPVASADSLWWLSAEYDYKTGFGFVPPPPTTLVTQLAFLMDTDSQRTGLGHIGTKFGDVGTGISQWLQQFAVTPIGDCDGDGDVDDDDIDIITAAWGATPVDPWWDMRADVEIDGIINALDLNWATINYGAVGDYNITTVEFPDFFWIEDEIYRCEDVVLFLEFWWFDGVAEWMPLFDNPSFEYGHFVTAAGVNSTTIELLIADPYQDAAEAGWIGDVPVFHPYPHASTVHNDAQYVSHDAYGASPWMGPPPPLYPPVPMWELMGYLQWLGYPPEWHAFIRAAIVTSPIHDVAVTDVFSIYDWVYQGDIDPINVTVQNQGPFAETVDVTAYYNGTPAAPTQVIVLNPGESKELTFNWDTTSVPLGNYTVSATAVIPYDNDLSDNFREGNMEEVRQPSKYFPWDVTGDGYVGIDDIVEVAEHFGQDPAHPDWDPKYDITGDNYVGIDDIVAVAEHFGEQDP